MPKPSDHPDDEWEAHRRQVIGLGEHSFRKSYYPQLRRNIINLKNLELAIEQSPRGVAILQADGTIEYANQTMLRLSRCCSDDVIGLSADVLWSHTQPAVAWESIRQVASAGKTWRRDLTVCESPEVCVWLHLSVAPIRDDTGDITHFLCGLEDISARKQAEAELQEVAQARQLALVAAQQLSALKSELLSNVSHELRTPIFQILGWARLAERSTQPEKHHQYAARIAQSAEQLAQIVASILDLAASEAGKLSIAPQRVLLSPLILDLAAKWQARCQQKGLEFVLEGDVSGLPALMTDQKRLMQVLDELLSNAHKYTPQGSVRLTVGVSAGDIQFAVADTGLGMSAAQQENCMKPFHQLDGSASRPASGLGLGLAIARHLVELMGGCLSVDSQTGVGSVFSLVLPLVPDSEC